MKRIKLLAVLAVLILFSAAFTADLHRYTEQEIWNVLAGESDLHGLTSQEAANQILADGFYLPAETKLGLSIESNGRLLTFVRNKSGDSLYVGAAVVWDSISVLAVDTVKVDAGPDTLVIADSLKDEGGAMFIRWKFYDTADNCSLSIYGVISTGDTITDTLAIVTENGAVYSTYRWSHLLTLVSFNTGADDSLSVHALPYYGIMTTAKSGSQRGAGIVAADCADNGVTAIVTFGPALTNVKCSTTTEGYPGIHMFLSSTAGRLYPRTTATAAQANCGFGKLITPSASSNQAWVFIDMQ